MTPRTLQRHARTLNANHNGPWERDASKLAMRSPHVVLARPAMLLEWIRIYNYMVGRENAKGSTQLKRLSEKTKASTL